MREGFPLQNENNKDARLLGDAKYVINAMWKKAMDVNDLPLSVDLSYQAWEGDLEARKHAFAIVLFNKAREATGEEKLRSARTLKRLMELLGNSSKQEVLKELMTTEEAVQELVRQAEQQVESKQTKPERLKTKFRKTVDRLLRRGDDFGDALK